MEFKLKKTSNEEYNYLIENPSEVEVKNTYEGENVIVTLAYSEKFGKYYYLELFVKRMDISGTDALKKSIKVALDNAHNKNEYPLVAAYKTKDKEMAEKSFEESAKFTFLEDL